MTFLIDIDGTPDDLEDLRNAGFDAEVHAGKISLIVPDGKLALRVAVDASLTEILSPPICFNCRQPTEPLENGSITIDGIGLPTIKITCAHCNAWEMRARYVVPEEDVSDAR